MFQCIGGDLAEVLTEYVDPFDDPIRTLVLVLKDLSNREVKSTN